VSERDLDLGDRLGLGQDDDRWLARAAKSQKVL
jgi:hypothetical protein